MAFTMHQKPFINPFLFGENGLFHKMNIVNITSVCMLSKHWYMVNQRREQPTVIVRMEKKKRKKNYKHLFNQRDQNVVVESHLHYQNRPRTRHKPPPNQPKIEYYKLNDIFSSLCYFCTHS